MIVSLELIYILSIIVALMLPFGLTIVTSLVKQKKINRLLSCKLSNYGNELIKLNNKFTTMKDELNLKLSGPDDEGEGNPNPEEEETPGS